MTRLRGELWLWLLTCAACAHSEPSAPASADSELVASSGGEQDVEDPIVCSMEKETGTRIRKRVCRSKSQADAEQQQAADLIRGSRPVGSQAPNAGMGGR